MEIKLEGINSAEVIEKISKALKELFAKTDECGCTPSESKHKPMSEDEATSKMRGMLYEQLELLVKRSRADYIDDGTLVVFTQEMVRIYDVLKP